MKKIIASILIGAMTASMLTACGGNTTPSTATTAAEVTTTQAATETTETTKATEASKAEYPVEVTYEESLKNAYPDGDFAMYCSTEAEGIFMLITMASSGDDTMIGTSATVEGNMSSFYMYNIGGKNYAMSTTVTDGNVESVYYTVTGEMEEDAIEDIAEDPEEMLAEDEVKKVMLVGEDVFEAEDGSFPCKIYEVTDNEDKVMTCWVDDKSGKMIKMETDEDGSKISIVIQNDLDKLELPEEFATEKLEEMTAEDASFGLVMPILAMAFAGMDDADFGDMSFIPETAVLDEATGLYVSEEADGIYVYLEGTEGYGYMMFDEKKESNGSMSMGLTAAEEKMLEENAEKALKNVLK